MGRPPCRRTRKRRGPRDGAVTKNTKNPWKSTSTKQPSTGPPAFTRTPATAEADELRQWAIARVTTTTTPPPGVLPHTGCEPRECPVRPDDGQKRMPHREALRQRKLQATCGPNYDDDVAGGEVTPVDSRSCDTDMAAQGWGLLYQCEPQPWCDRVPDHDEDNTSASCTPVQGNAGLNHHAPPMTTTMQRWQSGPDTNARHNTRTPRLRHEDDAAAAPDGQPKHRRGRTSSVKNYTPL
ncbi:hypothetical protein EDB85DRAFT_1897162 [Lactarius pseudohatsudake]|nr:hypothetical protein EDB85DRAFT_1897162 [Lactarius pseudohatsudake]